MRHLLLIIFFLGANGLGLFINVIPVLRYIFAKAKDAASPGANQPSSYTF